MKVVMPFLGSVLSSTFFLVVMDRLLTELKENKAGISICNLYLLMQMI